MMTTATFDDGRNEFHIILVTHKNLAGKKRLLTLSCKLWMFYYKKLSKNFNLTMPRTSQNDDVEGNARRKRPKMY